MSMRPSPKHTYPSKGADTLTLQKVLILEAEGQVPPGASPVPVPQLRGRRWDPPRVRSRLWCGDGTSHDHRETYPWLSGHDRFIVTQHNLSPACKSGTSPRDGGVIASSVVVGSLPPHHAPEPHPEEWEVTGTHSTALWVTRDFQTLAENHTICWAVFDTVNDTMCFPAQWKLLRGAC